MAPRSQRLLIIDDDEGIRRSLARIMRAKGVEVELANDGETAIELARSFRPHCLLVDIRLPGIDGVATFEAIRKFLPAVPAVFMTAYSASMQATAAHELGALCVLAKPFDISAIVQLVEATQQAAAVLIVDDDNALLTSLSRTLKKNGLQVETADSIRQALLSIRQRPNRVVVADVFLDDGFGYDLLTSMTQLTQSDGGDPADEGCNPSAIVDRYALVLVTGRADCFQEAPPPPFRENRFTCLSKPLNVEELIERIKHLQQMNMGA